MRVNESETVMEATSVLRGETKSPREILDISKKLKEEKKFGLARKILARARRDPKINDAPKLRIKIIQQQALCTYKDPDLPSDDKLDRAIEILREIGEDLTLTTDQETLGIAGAIHKRKWELDGQRQHLDRSLAYYYRGYKQGVAHDYGYTSINAAFVLDLLADQEETESEKAGTLSETAEGRRKEAQRIREEIVKTLPPLLEKSDNKWLEGEWWFFATMAEASFGLRRYEEAVTWLKKGKELNAPEWEFESTTRQLAALARLQDENLKKGIKLEESPAWKALYEFLGQNASGVHGAFLGKFGLALSGGGFRASLFHIGVLAKLAELDVLRHVEVLSCVSGGSIIGAHYYLEVRKLLQEKSDTRISRDDYIDLVKRLERDFLAGVQKNIRTRVAADWKTNLKMIFFSNYSRTNRVGELYEEEIFSRVDDKEGKKPRLLKDLFISPIDDNGNRMEDFNPKIDNWKRSAKVPILILNATTLNTGHNWQFTASFMGESPWSINSEIDGNDRLRRMYYSDAPDPYKEIRLGEAVAASSCVPGLFEPLVLDGLYPGRTVRLVDGGVYDNQGVAGLLEQDCTVLLVSDASGQMATQNDPSSGVLGVPLRTLDILMARVRDAEYRELSERSRTFLSRGFMFVHLKKDLDVDPVDWVDCQDPYEASDDARPIERRGVLTSYGINKEVQRRLASIRTDLDSFSDKEANALMQSGYCMTEKEFPAVISGFSFSDANNKANWQFLNVEREMRREPDEDEKEYQSLLRLLDVGKSKAFKIWLLFLAGLSPTLQKAVKVLGIVFLIPVLLWVSYRFWDTPLLTLGMVVWVIIGILIGSLVVGIIRWKKTLTQFCIGIGMAVVGFALAKIHLRYFDKWYLNKGSMKTDR